MPEPTGEKPIPPPPPNPGSNVDSSYKANPSDTWTVTEAFLAGLQIGGKAIVNGATSTIVSMVTIGQVNNVELITVTDTDRAYGYDYSFAAAQVATTSVMALATMGAGCAAAQGSRIAGVAVSSIRTVEVANAVNSVVTGTGNMIANGGVDVGNAVQVGTGLLGLGALKATACFTAGTQVVIDDKIRDEVYFTETSVTQSYDEINILFTLAGLSSAFVATTITIKKRKPNKPIPSIPKKIDQIDEGLLCEIDETKRTFSLQKWVLVPLLIIATIICGYFALPTTRTVAVSVPKIEIKNQLVTKGIDEIQCGDRVLGKNPVLSDEDRKLFGPEPTKETHYEYSFALPKEDGTVTFITLLRQHDWLDGENELLSEYETQTESGESERGLCVWLELPEVGVVGWAQLLSINEDFEIKSGNGNVVTGKFIHVSNKVIDLKIEGQAPIGCTDNHPFWSVDRQDYIKAGELREGEQVLLYSGETKRVEQKLPRPGPEIVYNIEVFGEHVYHITNKGILVHNTYKGHSAYRVMTEDEYRQAKKGIWKDSKDVGTTPSELGSKWFWDNKEAAKSWLNFIKSYGDEGIIVRVKVKNPLKTYEHYPHPPQGTAYHIPIEHLRKAKNVGTR
jgi:hypothetical protein